MKKIALITGVTGQDGSYLTEILLKKGYDTIFKHLILPNATKEYVLILITFSMDLDGQMQMNHVEW